MPKATNKGGDFTPVPAGIHHAICYAVIDLGTQPSQMYAPSRKVQLTWELPHERGDFKNSETGITNNLPRVISKEYTLSTGAKSNLRKELESWRGRPFTAEEAQEFEVGVLAGKNCRTVRIVFYVKPHEKAAAVKFAKRGMYQMSVGAVARYAFAQLMAGATK